MKFLSFKNLRAYLGFSSYVASKPSLSGISAEAAAPRLLLWQTAQHCWLSLTAPVSSRCIRQHFTLSQKCLTQQGFVSGEGLQRLLPITALFLCDVAGLWIVGGVDLFCTLSAARLPRYLLSCQNLALLWFALLRSVLLPVKPLLLLVASPLPLTT